MQLKPIEIKPWTRWVMGSAIALMIVVVPYVYYRMTYTTSKRLREVTPGLVYRSGCMSADGLREAIERHGIKTVINLMEEAPDPDLPLHYFSAETVKESELCRELGVRLVFLPVELVHPSKLPEERPATIDRFLEIMDDPGNYPVLIHCKAGLHRTGCLVAVYRMEYDGWTREQALRELKGHGFGEFKSTDANDYIVQYVLTYESRREARRRLAPAVPAVPVSRGLELYAPLPKGK